jgi:hypothetical protein
MCKLSIYPNRILAVFPTLFHSDVFFSFGINREPSEWKEGEGAGFVGHAPFSRKNQLIIKYLPTEIDYNRYSALGKVNWIPRPEVCPHCGQKGCLIGHGWYKKKGSQEVSAATGST